MNRRGFFGRIAGLLGVPFASKAPAERPCRDDWAEPDEPVVMCHVDSTRALPQIAAMMREGVSRLQGDSDIPDPGAKP